MGGKKYLPTYFGQRCLQMCPQMAICTNTAGHNQGFKTCLLQGLQRLCRQYVHYRCFGGGSQIGSLLNIRIFARCVQFTHLRHNSGFKAAEAEVEITAVQHRTRQRESTWVPLLCQTRELGATWVAQAQELGTFIKCFSGCVIQRFTQQAITSDAINLHQLCMTAGHQQSDKWKGRHFIGQQG
jgi:hypothetical protein